MDDMSELAILAIAMLGTGVAGGVIAGLLGVGGGIVIVPVLEWVLELLGVPADIRMHVAVATSLAVIIPTSISSARAHHKLGAVDIDLAKRWSPFIVIGAAVGILIASRVSGPVLTGVFGVVALLVAIKMALPLDQRTLTSEVPRGMATA
ncbi:MAG: sulfite exporter TauE/SafE family protein, partial [Gammaproteobacteria bacterium]|nr:sulfite exporter TauE/SafE family protein [Gammaproteobacteria bacterium]